MFNTKQRRVSATDSATQGPCGVFQFLSGTKYDNTVILNTNRLARLGISRAFAALSGSHFKSAESAEFHRPVGSERTLHLIKERIDDGMDILLADILVLRNALYYLGFG
jgi:hypothetical protein